MNKSKKNPVNLLSRECMVTALMQLLKDKPLSAISVSELTQKAGVSRMTYYRNYKSKEEILISYLDDLVYLYREDVKKHPISENYYDMRSLVRCFTYFAKYKDFLDSLFQSGLGYHFLEAVCGYVMEKWQKPEDGIEHFYELQAFSGAILTIYLSWASSGSRETPRELATILHNIYCPDKENNRKTQKNLSAKEGNDKLILNNGNMEEKV